MGDESGRTFSSFLLYVLRGADMHSTGDQPFTAIGLFGNYIPTLVIARWQSGAISGGCLGGIYPIASKGGDAIVAAGQSWLGLSGPQKIVSATLESVCGTDIQTATPIFSLSTGSSGACLADLFIFGVVLTNAPT